MSPSATEVQEPLDLAALGSVTLADLAGTAELLRRFERKHLVADALLPRAVAALGPRWRVLEVDGRRHVDYTSVYFDTDDLRTYRDHLQRRRRRFKVRTRSYGDPDRAVLEVKCKARRGQTVKHRWMHPGEAPDRLGAAAERLVDGALRDQYGYGAPAGLASVATTRFRRVTLVDLERAERVTIDRGLTVEADGRAIDLGSGYAVVEAKALGRRGTAAAALATLGLRPVAMSKYCVGIAASHEGIRGNPWLPVLRLVAPSPAPPADGARARAER